jgi:NAD(P)-dependent dehydrogenase (short-subunit alcohol dehydrogenase family)
MPSTLVFDEKTTAVEIVDAYKSDLFGYECIVTGAAAGVGVETAYALAKAGARVVMVDIDIARAERAAEVIRKETNNSLVEAEYLDLSSISSVNEFVKKYILKNRPLHILVNNAGIVATELTYTKEGFELTWATNHLGHFALTIGLIEPLKRGAKETGKNSRVVSVSSCGHLFSDICYDDINFEKRDYKRMIAYGNILFYILILNLNIFLFYLLLFFYCL